MAIALEEASLAAGSDLAQSWNQKQKEVPTFFPEGSSESLLFATSVFLALMYGVLHEQINKIVPQILQASTISDTELAIRSAAIEEANKNLRILCPEVSSKITETRTIIATCNGEELARLLFDTTGKIELQSLQITEAK